MASPRPSPNPSTDTLSAPPPLTNGASTASSSRSSSRSVHTLRAVPVLRRPDADMDSDSSSAGSDFSARVAAPISAKIPLGDAVEGIRREVREMRSVLSGRASGRTTPKRRKGRSRTDEERRSTPHLSVGARSADEKSLLQQELEEANDFMTHTPIESPLIASSSSFMSESSGPAYPYHWAGNPYPSTYTDIPPSPSPSLRLSTSSSFQSSTHTPHTSLASSVYPLSSSSTNNTQTYTYSGMSSLPASPVSNGTYGSIALSQARSMQYMSTSPSISGSASVTSTSLASTGDAEQDDVAYRLRLLVQNRYYLPSPHDKPTVQELGGLTMSPTGGIGNTLSPSKPRSRSSGNTLRELFRPRARSNTSLSSSPSKSPANGNAHPPLPSPNGQSGIRTSRSQVFTRAAAGPAPRPSLPPHPHSHPTPGTFPRRASSPTLSHSRPARPHLPQPAAEPVGPAEPKGRVMVIREKVPDLPRAAREARLREEERVRAHPGVVRRREREMEEQVREWEVDPTEEVDVNPVQFTSSGPAGGNARGRGRMPLVPPPSRPPPAPPRTAPPVPPPAPPVPVSNGQAAPVMGLGISTPQPAPVAASTATLTVNGRGKSPAPAQPVAPVSRQMEESELDMDSSEAESEREPAQAAGQRGGAVEVDPEEAAWRKALLHQAVGFSLGENWPVRRVLEQEPEREMDMSQQDDTEDEEDETDGEVYSTPVAEATLVSAGLLPGGTEGARRILGQGMFGRSTVDVRASRSRTPSNASASASGTSARRSVRRAASQPAMVVGPPPRMPLPPLPVPAPIGVPPLPGVLRLPAPASAPPVLLPSAVVTEKLNGVIDIVANGPRMAGDVRRSFDSGSESEYSGTDGEGRKRDTIIAIPRATILQPPPWEVESASAPTSPLHERTASASTAASASSPSSPLRERIGTPLRSRRGNDGPSRSQPNSPSSIRLLSSPSSPRSSSSVKRKPAPLVLVGPEVAAFNVPRGPLHPALQKDGSILALPTTAEGNGLVEFPTQRMVMTPSSAGASLGHGHPSTSPRDMDQSLPDRVGSPAMSTFSAPRASSTFSHADEVSLAPSSNYHSSGAKTTPLDQYGFDRRRPITNTPIEPPRSASPSSRSFFSRFRKDSNKKARIPGSTLELLKHMPSSQSAVSLAVGRTGGLSSENVVLVSNLSGRSGSSDAGISPIAPLQSPMLPQMLTQPNTPTSAWTRSQQSEDPAVRKLDGLLAQHVEAERDRMRQITSGLNTRAGATAAGRA